MIGKTSIIFDLDGTLVDSAESILAGFDYVLDLNRISPKRDLTSEIVGPPLTETLKLLSGITDNNKIGEMTEQFKAYYDKTACLMSKPYEGVHEGLARLKKIGFNLHVATNKRLIPTDRILSHLNWKDYFTSIFTLDMFDSSFDSKSAMIASQLKSNNINYIESIYIGDRVEDLAAAKANNLSFLGVLWGYGIFPKDVEVVSTFSELTARLEY